MASEEKSLRSRWVGSREKDEEKRSEHKEETLHTLEKTPQTPENGPNPPAEVLVRGGGGCGLVLKPREGAMDDQGCPWCKTTKYRNPSLKLMVNVCGHTLCESCVELLFMRGAGNCPECGTLLRKSNFREQLFEDPLVDKEVEIRKKMLKIYNKREDDFPSLREFNDFQEEFEEIIFKLTNNMDLDNTKKKIELYQKENKDVIRKNKQKLSREQEELEEALEVERQENEQRRLFIQKEEQLQQILKRKKKQALLDELERSDLPASLLLAQHKDRSTQLEMQLEKTQPIKPVTFSTGIRMGQHISLGPIQELEEAQYEYQPLQIETYGPQVPPLEMLGRLGYLNHVRAASPQDLAGGYTSSLACHRALQDGFSGLFWPYS